MFPKQAELANAVEGIKKNILIINGLIMKVRIKNPVMGVPITFLFKYNPNQFEIIWTSDRGGDGHLENIKNPKWGGLWDSCFVSNKKVYKRILIRKIKK